MKTNCTKEKQTPETNLGLPAGEGGGVCVDKLGVWDSHTALLYKVINQQRPTVEHRRLYSVLHNNLYGKII